MMENINIKCISAFFFILLIGCSESEVQDILKFNEVTNKFAWNLYKEVKQPFENNIVSPIGLQILLDVMLQAANGTTAAELAKVLQHEADDESILNAYKNFLEKHVDKTHTGMVPAFKLVTAIAVDRSFQLADSQVDSLLLKHLKAEIKKLNFKEDPQGSTKEINDWVLEYTFGEIARLLPEGSIDSSTEVVMVTGTSFKGLWKHKFNKKNTRVEPFHIKPDVPPVSVKMMGLTGGRFRYAWNSDLKVQIVELPYADDNFRMIIILPDTVGLTELETKLTYENLFELIHSVRETNVDVFLPRFKIKKSIKLINSLKKMGIVTAFSKHADFSKMTNSSISVSHVMQASKIVVNEKGTQAAAGTGVIISAKTLPPQMTCNSPFMYILLEGDTILFIGSFSKPSPLRD